ncbi:MAG: hypothetical protein AAF654_14135 [Myxococcota bacterium]
MHGTVELHLVSRALRLWGCGLVFAKSLTPAVALRLWGCGLRAFSVLALLLAVGCSSDPQTTNCTINDDCGPTQSCARGICVETDLSCSATNPCPGGQSCCGGICSATGCCEVDQDCTDGWCDDGVCVDGSRPQCSTANPCEDGICLTVLSRCVECVDSSDCGPGRVCTLGNQCEVPGTCALNGNCGNQGLVCDSETGNCRPCVARVECGDLACIQGTCAACTGANDCGTNRNCVDGRCVNAPGAACQSDFDCTDGLICSPADTCEACQLASECPNPGTQSCTLGRCVSTDGDCTQDNDCSPPDTICSGGSCRSGCQSSGCATGETCDPLTGRCLPFSVGTLPIGQECTDETDCASNVCWPVRLSPTVVEAVCTKTCVRTRDCPTDFVCATLGDAAICLPKRIVNGNAPYNRLPGDACTDGFISDQCKSGFCDQATNRCIETCATDADCAEVDDNYVCTHRNTVGNDINGDDLLSANEIFGFGSLCQPPVLLGRANGAECIDNGQIDIDHTVCSSNFCAQTPDFFTTARCATGCCTPADCPGNLPICKPIDLWDGVRDDVSEPFGFQRTCLWTEYEGTKRLGEVCLSDAECESEICARGDSGIARCSQTCCRPTDCSGLSWSVGCRTPLTNGPTSVDDQLFDPNFDENRGALGRRLITSVTTAAASGLTTFCMPE